MNTILIAFAAVLSAVDPIHASSSDLWSATAPRDEIRPQFQQTDTGGKSGRGALIIRADEREGLHGWWQKTFPVSPGQYYRFSAWRRTENVPVPRRTGLARVIWRDDAGKDVKRPEGVVTNYSIGVIASAEPEYPRDITASSGSGGWMEVSGVYQAPPGAAQARVELHLLWAANGKVEWSDISLAPIEPPAPRKVRVASAHYRPRSAKTPMDACRQFAPVIEEAARQKADLVVLGETLTYAGVGKAYADSAESIPGPSTGYFGELAKKHNLHIVAGLIERDRHQLFNVAVLIAPDGKLAGKYRKVCLPDGEFDNGISPGTDYPVFETRLGKIGMMICYDGFFPEVARELSNRGAEIIAWPVWGCNPEQARARATENQVYIVSSTYEDVSRNWMQTAVYGHDGNILAQARDWGKVCVAEVDLNRPTIWTWLGNFKEVIPRHRPIARGE
jgi:predicted amidohydrolase